MEIKNLITCFKHSRVSKVAECEHKIIVIFSHYGFLETLNIMEGSAVIFNVSGLDISVPLTSSYRT